MHIEQMYEDEGESHKKMVPELALVLNTMFSVVFHHLKVKML